MDCCSSETHIISSPGSYRGNKTPQNARALSNCSKSSREGSLFSFESIKTTALDLSYEDVNSSFGTSSPQNLTSPTGGTHQLIFVLTFLDLVYSGETLTVSGNNKKGTCPVMTNLYKIQKVIVDFTEFNFGKEEVVELSKLFKNLQNIISLEFIIRNKKEEEMIGSIIECFSVIFTGELNYVQSLKVDLFRSKIALECVDYLNKEAFKTIRYLKSFRINLWGSNVNNQNIQRLAWNVKHFFGELEEFNCNLGHTKVTEKVLIQFFHSMPRMKKFEMSVGNCTFSDYALKIFIRNTLLSMKDLESLSFQLEGTKISSSQVQDLFIALPESLQKLHLDLRWTRTCNETLQYFIDKRLPSLEHLIEMELKTDCTLASKRVMKEIERINKQYARKIDHQACLEYLLTLNKN